MSLPMAVQSPAPYLPLVLRNITAPKVVLCVVAASRADSTLQFRSSATSIQICMRPEGLKSLLTKFAKNRTPSQSTNLYVSSAPFWQEGLWGYMCTRICSFVSSQPTKPRRQSTPRTAVGDLL